MTDRNANNCAISPLLFHVLQGIFLEMAGPTLPGLKSRTGTNFEEISRVLVARNMGYAAGALLGGFLCDRFKRHVELVVTIAFLLSTIGTAVTPWCTQLWLLGIFFHLQGLGVGLVDTGKCMVLFRFQFILLYLIKMSQCLNTI